MSHLIIEQGHEVGREIVVPPAGIKFGRSPANDLVLEDNAVMLFHGRFFFKSDGTLWVTDFGAGEKTTVGGMPIDEYQLEVGNLVEVGATAFRIINTKQSDGEETPSLPAVGKMDAEQQPGEIDLGFRPSGFKSNEPRKQKESQGNGSLLSRFMQVTIGILVAGVLVFIILEATNLSKTSSSKIAPKKNTLALSYERVQGDKNNIFRYQLDLDEKGNFKVVVDDLKNNRHVQKEKTVPETMMLQLASQLDDTRFFDVESDYVGIAEDQYDLWDLTIRRNRRYHHVRVLNRLPPQQVKRAASVIEDFALSEVRVLFTFLKNPEELRRYAEQSFHLGEARFEERELRHGNLAEAITHFEEAMLYLGTFEPKPALYFEAEKQLVEVSKKRDEKYEDYMFRADRAIRLREWETADKHLAILSELVPDRSDPRYAKINSKKLNVEQYLR